jgi:hypothetical protein
MTSGLFVACKHLKPSPMFAGNVYEPIFKVEHQKVQPMNGQTNKY